MATRNIEAKDIATVQVFENHQPVKALRDKVFSDEAAVNLKLKDQARGMLAINAKLGVGLKPLRWDNELTAMQFKKRRQQLSTYGGNNTGSSAAGSAVRMHYPEPPGAATVSLGIQSPSTPAISENRYLFNRAHVLAVNNLYAAGNDSRVTVNLNYLNDRRQKSSFSRSAYYLPADSVLVMEESLASGERISELGASVRFSRNTSLFFQENQLDFTGKWNSSGGTVETPEKITRHLSLPIYALKHTFSLVKNVKKSTFRVNSRQLYRSMPHSLEVQPMLYAGLSDAPAAAAALYQELLQRQFHSANRVSLGRSSKAWKQNIPWAWI